MTVACSSSPFEVSSAAAVTAMSNPASSSSVRLPAVLLGVKRADLMSSPRPIPALPKSTPTSKASVLLTTPFMLAPLPRSITRLSSAWSSVTVPSLVATVSPTSFVASATRKKRPRRSAVLVLVWSRSSEKASLPATSSTRTWTPGEPEAPGTTKVMLRTGSGIGTSLF
ncbi:MAG: hypothetical protein NZ555_06905 [Geminicoccaceae bacterium]|nr:hypothetical protein [Geminicoccaceae bacterium]